MSRTTIDFGIDLGTTNSAIAVLSGIEPQIITNSVGATITPSAVYIDKRGRVRVGREAKDRRIEDEDNTDLEFKSRMGIGERGKKRFAASGIEMTPQQLSAEVLKSLKADVQTQMGEELRSAVITVPAAFELAECDATRESAGLAGFEISPLLMEPVAAALAYGFQDESEKLYWLVYDFGGGTFDAAILQMREGVIQVVNHAGDNHLGGKLLDWDIVDKFLAPALTKRYRLNDFRRGEPKWRAVYAKLKQAAEQGKIEVCRSRNAYEIFMEDVWEDDSGKMMDLEYNLSPTDIQEVIKPYVARSMNLCKQALDEKGLGGRNMAKILMVGGTSLIPWLRDEIQKGIGAELEFSIDPMTVVARGAAIFAGSQRKPQGQRTAPLPVGTFEVKLEYEAVGSDEDPELDGQVVHPQGKSLSGYAIEFVETRSQWTSGRIPLKSDGAFDTVLLAERGRKCEFAISLYDPTGTKLATDPPLIPYTMGLVIDGVPLIHSVGVAMANNQLDMLIKKGTALKARAKSIYRTAYSVKRGDGQELLNVPIVEGENISRADRNRHVGTLEVPSDKIKRDLPAGSEVEITLEIDESRLITTRAFIPILDQEFEATMKLSHDVPDPGKLRNKLQKEKERLEKLRGQAGHGQDSRTEMILSKIDRENMLPQVEQTLRGADGDLDAAQQCEKRLQELQIAIDNAEDALEWPNLVKKAEEALAYTRGQVNGTYGNENDRARLRVLEGDLRMAIDSGDPDLLRNQTEQMNTLGHSVFQRDPGLWIGLFQSLQNDLHLMRDRSLAEQLIAQGHRAVNNNDVEGLKAIVRQLLDLLPSEQRESRGGGLGGSLTK